MSPEYHHQPAEVTPRLDPSISATEPRSTEEEGSDPRSARQREVLQLLQQGTEQILTDEGFTSYLTMLSRFHTYSWANTLLIMAQQPEATRVNSYTRWQALGRQVMKGERGIKIYFPFTKKLDPEKGTAGEEERSAEVVTGFGIGNVFDISQTEGDPLPEPPTPFQDTASDERAKEVNLRLSRWLIDEGLTLESKAFPGNAGGFYLPTREQIVIRQRLSFDEEDGTASALDDPLSIYKTKTLVHEAGHYVADHRGTVSRHDAETVAESSAFVTLQHFGIDTGRYSFPYVAFWARDRDVLKRNLHEIQQVSTRLIQAVEGIADPWSETALNQEEPR